MSKSLQEAIHDGGYRVDAHAVAEAILSRLAAGPDFPRAASQVLVPAEVLAVVTRGPEHAEALALDNSA